MRTWAAHKSGLVKTEKRFIATQTAKPYPAAKHQPQEEAGKIAVHMCVAV
jgi:hypothetical protein